MKTGFAFAAAAIALFACDPFATSDTNGAGPASGPGNSSVPQLTLVAPADHHEFEFKDEDDHHHGDDDFDVEVEVEHANLAAPGKCSGSDPCGHLVLLVDGVACGSPNASSSTSKFKGKFGRCATVSGPHQIVVQLVDDQGKVLAATEPITVDVTFKGHHAASDDQGDHDEGDDHGGHGGADHGQGHG
ncbi:MAG TPA: hypothetical protein VG496_06855 [Myxococcales bacterium]|nr:hypothetical protein [Myxococcales bacterium]